MSFVDNSIKILKKSDYKITGPRMTLLEMLSKVSIPLSAYNIEERLSSKTPINLVTIYRVLELFEKLGIAHRIHTREGFIRCDFEGRKGCHSFAVCSKCGRSSEFINSECTIPKLIPKDLALKKPRHLSEVSGVCAYCNLTINK